MEERIDLVVRIDGCTFVRAMITDEDYLDALNSAFLDAVASRHWLGEILAVIHRDGGHELARLGIEAATQKAIGIVHRGMAALEAEAMAALEAEAMAALEAEAMAALEAEAMAALRAQSAPEAEEDW